MRCMLAGWSWSGIVDPRRQMRELARASRQRWLEALLLLALVTGQRRGDLAKMRFAECIRSVCGETAYQAAEWPSLHEVRSLSARLYSEQGIDVQTLLGHKHAEMTPDEATSPGLSYGSSASRHASVAARRSESPAIAGPFQ